VSHHFVLTDWFELGRCLQNWQTFPFGNTAIQSITECGFAGKAPRGRGVGGSGTISIRHGGHRELKNSKQGTDQTVLTIKKALTKTSNCTFRANKVEGHDRKKFRRFAPDRCPHSGTALAFWRPYANKNLAALAPDRHESVHHNQ